MSDSASPFTRHLREAIALNLERAPRYAALTEGRTRPLSRRLVRGERLALPAARWIDWRSRRLRAAGVGVVRDDFVEMSGAGEFRERMIDPAPLVSYRAPDRRALAGRLRAGWHARGFQGLRDAAQAELDGLASAPTFHAMLRHILESARRVAHLAPRHAKAADAAGLASPLPISRSLVRLHLLAVPEALRLDRMAAPFQAEGVPILLQDLPPIPMEG